MREGFNELLLTPDLSDFKQVDQRLHGVTLRVVVSKPVAIRQSMIRENPIMEQSPGGFSGVGITGVPPLSDLFLDRRHAGSGGHPDIEERSRWCRFLFASHQVLTSPLPSPFWSYRCREYQSPS